MLAHADQEVAGMQQDSEVAEKPGYTGGAACDLCPSNASLEDVSFPQHPIEL